MNVKDAILALLMTSSTITEKFIELVILRLKDLTYEVIDEDAFSLAFNMQTVENTIRNSCNTASIPDGLLFIAVDMVCGQFLMQKKQTNSLGDSFDVDLAIKSVKLGDVNVSLGDKSDESKLDWLFSYLMKHGESEFVCYRRICW